MSYLTKQSYNLRVSRTRSERDSRLWLLVAQCSN